MFYDFWRIEECFDHEWLMARYGKNATLSKLPDVSLQIFSGTQKKDKDDRHIQFLWVHAEGRRWVLGVCYLAKLGPLDIRKLKVQHRT